MHKKLLCHIDIFLLRLAVYRAVCTLRQTLPQQLIILFWYEISFQKGIVYAK